MNNLIKKLLSMYNDEEIKYENNHIVFIEEEEKEMNEKYLILQGNENEIDQLEEYIRDYQQSTREIPSIEILGNDLFKAYWSMELECVKDHPSYNITNEKMDKIIEDFRNDGETWDNIDQSINDYICDLKDRIERNIMEW